MVLSEVNFHQKKKKMLFEIPDLILLCLDLELVKMLT